MSDLVSMKLDAKARKAMMSPSLVTPEGPIYPWGLSISLDDEALDKLDIDTLPKVDSTMLLIAEVKVTSVASSAGPDSQKRRSVGLQITEMCLEPATSDAAKALYPKD